MLKVIPDDLNMLKVHKYGNRLSSILDHLSFDNISSLYMMVKAITRSWEIVKLFPPQAIDKSVQQYIATDLLPTADDSYTDFLTYCWGNSLTISRYA